jgi:hypothetical protein
VNCASTGLENDCGAAILCQATCNPTCPLGLIKWLDPPQTVLDARRPFTPTASPTIEGIRELLVEAPLGADKLQCWELCETASTGGSNNIDSITLNPNGTMTLGLHRPITRGAVTKISYRDDKGIAQTAELTSHPANANGDGLADASDTAALLEELLGMPSLPAGPFSQDVDRDGVLTPADLIEHIDLLNGAGPYLPANGTVKPVAGVICP